MPRRIKSGQQRSAADQGNFIFFHCPLDGVRFSLRFFKLMCATSLGKLCASDHAMNAIDEMSALNRDIKRFFDENGAAYPVWQALEAEAGRYLR